jgi:hypothetical protein
MAYLDLCKPCTEELKRAGKTVIFQSGGVNNKITCDFCGQRRYGATYAVSRSKRKAGKV